MIRLATYFPLVVGLVLLAGTGRASGYEVRSETVAVVELFTSQGCSQCPPADAFLAELGAREGVVALAYHIDYWDYIGWEDTFALPAHTELQKAYAASWGKNRVYTPQMVINGAHGVVGSHTDKVEGALAQEALALAPSVSIGPDDTAHLSVPAVAGLPQAIVWLVTWREGADVSVARGENSGKVLRYTHIVTGRQAIGMWNAQIGAEIAIPLEAAMGHNDGMAVIVQEKRGDLPGRVLGAAQITR
ncbi:DUF1223 domain-containing protein [Pelagibacterium limicola]|uniref:DUF1223 domain-containing protein n=1 Tax=Pelagibacterium limicola TaxID=2791022 RepID=UPI0018B0027B|nr:DUF1223 domain-containing protein [Pelagibacterium limicola]